MKRLLLLAALLNLTACPELSKKEKEEEPGPCVSAALSFAPPAAQLKLHVSESLLAYALLLPAGEGYFINLSCTKSGPYEGAIKVYCGHAKIADSTPGMKEITVQGLYFLTAPDSSLTQDIGLVDAQGNLVDTVAVPLQKEEKEIPYSNSSCGRSGTMTHTYFSGTLLE